MAFESIDTLNHWETPCINNFGFSGACGYSDSVFDHSPAEIKICHFQNTFLLLCYFFFNGLLYSTTTNSDDLTAKKTQRSLQR